MDVVHSNVVYDQVFPGKRIVSIVPDIGKVDSFDQQQKRVALHFTPEARGRLSPSLISAFITGKY